MRVIAVFFLLTTLVVACSNGDDNRRSSMMQETPASTLEITPPDYPTAPTNEIAVLPDGTAGADEGFYDGTRNYDEAIELGAGNDRLVLRAGADIGLADVHIDMGAGADEVFIEAGRWASYDGGEAPSDAVPLSIYGGSEVDTLILSGGTLGSIIGEAGVDDTFYYRGGTVEGTIDFDSGDNYLVLASDEKGLAHTITLGDGNNDIFLTKGCYADYRTGGTSALSTVDCDGNGAAREIRPTIIGAGTFQMTGGVLHSVIGDGSGLDFVFHGGAIRGDIVGDNSKDELMLGGDDVGGNIMTHGGDDEITLAGGVWEAYHGGALAAATGTCAASNSDRVKCIYGGAGEDELIIDGATIGAITGEDDAADKVTYTSGKITGGILLGSGDDELTLNNPTSHDDFGEGYTIDMGDGDDEIIVMEGNYFGYSGAPAPSGFRLCIEGILDFLTPRCLHGGEGVDTLKLAGGFIANIAGGDEKDIVIYEGGDGGEGMALRGGDDEITLSAPLPDIGDVQGNEGEDSITLEEGAWTAYFGGHPPTGIGECGSYALRSLCIYGGEDTDTFTLTGTGEIDYIIGDHDGSDIIILEAGQVGFVKTGDNSGDNIVRILGTFGNATSGADIVFTDDCSDPDNDKNAIWICGGAGNDRIEFLTGVTPAITSSNTNDFDDTCEVSDADGTEVSCTDAAPASLGAFAQGFSEVSVAPDAQLWGGLSSALQSFGRAMMDDFTSSFVIPSVVEESGNGRTAPLTRPFDFTRFTRFAQGDSKGSFHAREVQLRGNSTTHLTVQGVEGAVGTSSYSHDVNLIQHGFSTPVAAGLVAEGGFHLMQGTLASSDGADQFGIEGYGAGMKLAYGMADVAMLGAWFDLASDDWGKPMAFSGTQWIISAGLEQEMMFGGLSITPQARGFWQRTNIEEQGAIRFSDAPIFTGKVGIVAQAGNHAFGLFFTRDDEASSLDTGLVQNHRVEEAAEAGWRNTMASGASGDFSLMGEIRYRHGLETGTDSYSAGIAGRLSF